MAGRNTTRAWLWGLVAVAVIGSWGYRSSVLSKPGPPKTTRVAFVTGGSDAYWQLAARGAEQAAKDHNVQLRVDMPLQDEGIAEQVKLISALPTDELDGIALSPLDPETETRLINRLVEKLYVLTYDSDAPLSNRHCYIGTSNFFAGQACARMVKEAAPDGGKVAVLLANQSKDNMVERTLGFEDEIKQTADEAGSAGSSAYQVLPFMTDEGDPNKVRENLLAALTEHQDLVCVVGMNGYHGPLLIDVLRSEKQLGAIKVVAFDEAEETLQGIEDGHIYATIAQDPYKYGYESVHMLAALNNGKAAELPIVGGAKITVSCGAIRKQELPEFRQRLAERLNGQSKK